MSIQCTIVPVTPYQQNCSIIKCEVTGKAAIVDPGGDVERILAAVEQMDASVEKIILTHAHLDHCSASDILRSQLQVPIEGPHSEDEFWLQNLPEACRRSGFPVTPRFVPDRWLAQGEGEKLGEQRL